MTVILKRAIIILFCLTLVSACTPTKKEALQDSEDNITAVFKDKQEPMNAKMPHFTYNKPSDLTISQKGEHNVIFQDSNKNVFILFVNPKENHKSKLDYQTVKKQMHPGDELKSMQVGDSFIYVYLKPIKGEDVELIVGAGGVKMSTKTSLNRVDKLSKMMAQIIHSVRLVKKKG